MLSWQLKCFLSACWVNWLSQKSFLSFTLAPVNKHTHPHGFIYTCEDLNWLIVITIPLTRAITSIASCIIPFVTLTDKCIILTQTIPLKENLFEENGPAICPHKDGRANAHAPTQTRRNTRTHSCSCWNIHKMLHSAARFFPWKPGHLQSPSQWKLSTDHFGTILPIMHLRKVMSFTRFIKPS